MAKSIKHRLLNSFIGASILLAPGMTIAKWDDQSVSVKISLTANIPDAAIGNVLKSYSVDGYYRRLDYDTDTSSFKPIYFQIRTEKPLNETLKNYTVTETYNTLTCSSKGGSNTSVEMIVQVDKNKMDATNKVDLTRADLWYEGTNNYLSDIIIDLQSPVIGMKSSEQWCSGRASFLVSETL